MWILLGGMGEPFEGGKGFPIGESQNWYIRQSYLKVERSYLVEKRLCGSKPGAMRRLVGKNLPDGSGCFRPQSLLLVRRAPAFVQYSIAGTSFQRSQAKACEKPA